MKKVELICGPEMKFSLGDEVVTAANLTVDQAELIAGQYPDQYVRIVETKPVKTVAESATAK
ncbi:hypothetical protein [uncultured Fibrella sp.]|uniref:hypothetical protein n=1 Tax=uncultured Fibrella sp. TaxID=1284596 RepID=UPI0035C97193